MTKKPRSATDEPAIDLSAAARAVVRDSGDPRIDAHLAALGLGEQSAPTADARAGGPGRAREASAAAAEVVELRRRIGELEGELQASRARLRSLGIVVVATTVATLFLLAVLVLR